MDAQSLPKVQMPNRDNFVPMRWLHSVTANAANN